MFPARPSPKLLEEMVPPSYSFSTEACTPTSPPAPPPRVSASRPLGRAPLLPEMLTSALAIMLTLPARPLPTTSAPLLLSSKPPLKLRICAPSRNCMLSTRTRTLPALPSPTVVESITPPPITSSGVVTVSAPALPAGPAAVAVKMPLSPPLISIRSLAWIVRSPAFPGPPVELLMRAPSLSVSNRVVMFMAPAAPPTVSVERLSVTTPAPLTGSIAPLARMLSAPMDKAPPVPGPKLRVPANPPLSSCRLPVVIDNDGPAASA